MRDPKRISIINKKIEEIWQRYPDMRFGQLVHCLFGTSDIFNIEDDVLEARIIEFAVNHGIKL